MTRNMAISEMCTSLSPVAEDEEQLPHLTPDLRPLSPFSEDGWQYIEPRQPTPATPSNNPFYGAPWLPSPTPGPMYQSIYPLPQPIEPQMQHEPINDEELDRLMGEHYAPESLIMPMRTAQQPYVQPQRTRPPTPEPANRDWSTDATGIRRIHEQVRYELTHRPLAHSGAGLQVLELAAYNWSLLPNGICVTVLWPYEDPFRVCVLARYVNWMELACRAHRSPRARILGISHYEVLNEVLVRNGGQRIVPILRDTPPGVPSRFRPGFTRPGFVSGLVLSTPRRRQTARRINALIAQGRRF